MNFLRYKQIHQPSCILRNDYGSVHPAYNSSFSACFFSRNSIFLSQQISQRCFSADLSAQPNVAYTTSAPQSPKKTILGVVFLLKYLKLDGYIVKNINICDIK
jgi:hypothetical protein